MSFNGQDGYIKTEFLEKVETDAADQDAADDTEEETQTQEANTAFDAGETITLPTTVNVRESMSETASKVAVAYAGEQVKVIMMYQEGWTKVEYKGKTGYVKSEFLSD